MRLTRLELSGFKSFADTVELPFEDGITCIVGPNGCGKSNVSDAVRWVLGEQRARMLRGSRMDEVIFQGSSKRKPLNISEVSLFFDNSDGKLPISYREVAITRRLSRSGQSEYLLNQTPTRLKDVQDLLRGTGLGSDAGVVIEARMIDRLLSDRTEERRSLFEEAAGIGLYRDRKGITERRLEKTLDDLQRLDDLISEVQSQVRSLARQRGRAERHHKFTEERFGIVMELARREMVEFQDAARNIEHRRAEVSGQLPQHRESLSTKEHERETRVQERAAAEAQRTSAERRLGDRRLEAEKIEGDLRLTNERVQNTTERKERAREEREQCERRASQARLELRAAAEERDAATSARQSVQIELDLRAANEDEARERLVTQRDRVRTLEESRQERVEAYRALSGERTAIEREMDELRGQTDEARRRLEEATHQVEQVQDRLGYAHEAMQSCDDADRKAAGEVEQARHALAAAREHEAAMLARKRTAEETASQLGARSEALEALEQERAGLAPAARHLLADRERFGDGAVLGPLSDFVRTSPTEARLAERVLTEWLHAVVVRDDGVVDEVRRWHAERHPGPIVLLPVSPGPRPGPNGESSIVALDVAEPAQAWAEVLLAGHVNLDHDGRAIRRANGAVFLPGTEEATGPLSRRAEIDAVNARLTDAKNDLDHLDRLCDEAARAHAEAVTALDAHTASAETAKQMFHESKVAHDDLLREAQRAERDKGEAQEIGTRLTGRMTERVERFETVDRDLTRLEQERAHVEEELDRERRRLAGLEAEQEAARESRVHWQVEEAQVSARESAAAERQERAADALLVAEQEIERLDHELGLIDASTSDLAQQRSRWTDALEEMKVEIAELETAAAAADAAVQRADEALNANERELAAARAAVHDASEQLHKLEIHETELGGKRQALRERVEAEWRKPLEALLDSAAPVEGDAETLTDEADRLKHAIESIGLVNPLAAQEYEEEKTRLDFLQTQREDLMDARISLRQSLKEIDETAKALFTETFSAVSEYFQRVFQTLFEGGECDVILSDPSDPLGSDIEIRAAPRGKRTQRIHLLSSGERALVAISLLFAIYLAKPSPFCLLDEVDAPLDDANVQRFIRLLTEFKVDTQFIVITHNPRTMQVADAVYGVTMQEPGVSTIVGVRLGEHAHA